jgi:hypothetical protein
VVDKDAGMDGEVRFGIQSGDVLPIAIDHVTGELHLVTKLDSESNASFEFVATVTDTPDNPADALTTTLTITVYVVISTRNKYVPEFQTVSEC